MAKNNVNMKILTCILFSLVCVPLMAQQEMPLSPSPRDPFTVGMKKMTAKQIEWKIYSYEKLISTKVINYTYSEDGLTVTDGSNTYEFYPDGKVKYIERPINNIYDTYTYTDDGKLLSIECPDYKRMCYYTNTDVDSMVTWAYSDRLQTFVRSMKYVVTYNPNGYRYSEYRYGLTDNQYYLSGEYMYEFDEQGRLVKEYNINDERFYSERAYSENSIIVYDSSVKHEYICNDKGDLIEYNFIQLETSGVWVYNTTMLYTYTYDETTSNERIDPDDFQISVSSNTIVIRNAGYGERVLVSTVSGNVCYSGVVTADNYTIELPAGQIYFVRVGEKSVKLRL